MSNQTRVMPAAVLEVFDPLKNELTGIHERWALFRQVFGVDESRIELLNRIAGIFFGHTQWALYLDVILALCRYTDAAESAPKKPGHRPNLTLERLVNSVTANDPAFGAVLQAGEWDAVKNWRNNHFAEIRSGRIAHNDLKKFMARFNGQPVGWPSREQVGRFLTLSTEVMGKVHEHYVGCSYGFDAFASEAIHSADTLVRVLTEYAEQHDADVMAGKRAWAISPSKDFLNRFRVNTDPNGDPKG